MKLRTAKKAAYVTAAALLFGTVSGSVIAGINYAGSQIITAYNAEETTSSSQIAASSVSQTAATQTSTTTQSSVTDVSSIVEKVMPSVVAISDTMTVQQRDMFGRQQTYEAQSSGSGFIIAKTDTELLIATNNHVVENAENLSVTFVDDTSISGAVKGTDAAADLAIVAVQLSDIPEETLNSIQVASLGDSDQLKVGQQVIAIGNALGYGQSVTVGYVSALNREIQNEDGTSSAYIQTDAAINPGNSGGALLDLNGNVIGINTAKTASTEVEGMGYAIPITKAQEILNQLMTQKTLIAVDEASQGSLGIQALTIDSSAAQSFGMPQGVYVYQITEGGAASQSELHEMDIITAFDGHSVSTVQDLTSILSCYEQGTEVTLTVQRLEEGTYAEHSITLTLGAKEDISSSPQA